jgi:regulator of PEP synthase PpsR (kinase-PPPase family)
MNYIYVVSDGTGGTAERALNAALVQFTNVEVNIKCRSEVRTEQQIHQIIHEVVHDNAFIVHTLVKDELRQVMVRMGREHNVETIDLMGKE